MLAPRVPERREGGSGVGETRDGGGSGLIRPKYPPNRRNRSDAPLPPPLALESPPGPCAPLVLEDTPI